MKIKLNSHQWTYILLKSVTQFGFMYLLCNPSPKRGHAMA
jgi:hypothetical protein